MFEHDVNNLCSIYEGSYIQQNIIIVLFLILNLSAISIIVCKDIINNKLICQDCLHRPYYENVFSIESQFQDFQANLQLIAIVIILCYPNNKRLCNQQQKQKQLKLESNRRKVSYFALKYENEIQQQNKLKNFIDQTKKQQKEQHNQVVDFSSQIQTVPNDQI